MKQFKTISHPNKPCQSEFESQISLFERKSSACGLNSPKNKARVDWSPVPGAAPISEQHVVEFELNNLPKVLANDGDLKQMFKK